MSNEGGEEEDEDDDIELGVVEDDKDAAVFPFALKAITYKDLSSIEITK
jgi:hypothetical protein